jgi:hypothetical protein
MKDNMESYIEAYTTANPDYAAIQTTILNSSDWMGFLMVLPGNQLVLVHLLGLFSTGLGGPTPAHNRMFGLLGKKVGTDLPPIVMVPSACLIPWLRIQSRYQPRDNNLEVFESGRNMTIPRPTTEDYNDKMSVQNICFVTKAWAPYFLAPMLPWNALKVFRRLLAQVPPPLQTGFDFLGSWLAIACTHDKTDPSNLVL